MLVLTSIPICIKGQSIDKPFNKWKVQEFSLLDFWDFCFQTHSTDYLAAILDFMVELKTKIEIFFTMCIQLKIYVLVLSRKETYYTRNLQYFQYHTIHFIPIPPLFFFKVCANSKYHTPFWPEYPNRRLLLVRKFLPTCFGSYDVTFSNPNKNKLKILIF